MSFDLSALPVPLAVLTTRGSYKAMTNRPAAKGMFTSWNSRYDGVALLIHTGSGWKIVAERPAGVDPKLPCARCSNPVAAPDDPHAPHGLTGTWNWVKGTDFDQEWVHRGCR